MHGCISAVNIFLRFFCFFPQQRREIAKKAADARWAGHVKKARTNKGRPLVQHGNKSNGKHQVKPETIKSKSGHIVVFGDILNGHLKAKDKDRSDRWRDMEHAKNAVRNGTCEVLRTAKGKRLKFTHHFTTKQGKKYKMSVIAVKKGRNNNSEKRWQVLTYHRFR